MLKFVISDLADRLGPKRAAGLRRILVFFAAVLFVFSTSGQALAQTNPACAPEMARVTSIQGEVEFQTREGEGWRVAALDDVLCLGSVIRVGAFSRAALVFTDDSTLRLDQSTTLVIRGREAGAPYPGSTWSGAPSTSSATARNRTRHPDPLRQRRRRRHGISSIRVSEERARIILMFEGIVLASNPEGEIRLGPNDAALIRERPKTRSRRSSSGRAMPSPGRSTYPDVFSDLADRTAEPGAYPVRPPSGAQMDRARTTSPLRPSHPRPRPPDCGA